MSSLPGLITGTDPHAYCLECLCHDHTKSGVQQPPSTAAHDQPCVKPKEIRMPKKKKIKFLQKKKKIILKSLHPTLYVIVLQLSSSLKKITMNAADDCRHSLTHSCHLKRGKSMRCYCYYFFFTLGSWHKISIRPTNLKLNHS